MLRSVPAYLCLYVVRVRRPVDQIVRVIGRRRVCCPLAFAALLPCRECRVMIEAEIVRRRAEQPRELFEHISMQGTEPAPVLSNHIVRP